MVDTLPEHIGLGRLNRVRAVVETHSAKVREKTWDPDEAQPFESPPE